MGKPVNIKKSLLAVRDLILEDRLLLESEDFPTFFSSGRVEDTLKRISKFYDNKGDIIGSDPLVEGYAIALSKAKKYVEAKRFFDAITEKGLAPLRKDHALYFASTEGKLGRLGYEGVYYYAEACLKVGEKKRAKELLLILTELPEEMRSCAERDTRYGAFYKLVHSLKMPLQEGLKKAEALTY